MPVSKKRKPKRRPTAPIKSSPVGSSASASTSPKKKKLSRQQIIIYVVSIAMILSLAISYLIGNGRGVAGVPPTVTPVVAQTTTPAPPASGEAQPSPTAEPTQAN